MLPLLALRALLALAPAADRSPAQPDLPGLHRDHGGAIVLIRASYADDAGRHVAAGTGTLLPDGRVLTACHVLRHGPNDKTEADSFEVIFAGVRDGSGAYHPGQRLPAKVFRCDRERDLALLTVSSKLPLPRGLELSPSAPRPGLSAAALGHSSRGLPWTIHGCTIAGVGRLGRDDTAAMSGVDASPAATRPGKPAGLLKLEVECDRHPNSGSPLLDAKGRILGMVQHVNFDPRDVTNVQYTFYIAASEIRAFLSE